MKKEKGFISIIAAIAILVAGSIGLYGYSQSLEKKIEMAEQNLGGSTVATRYGGLGQDASAWDGLIRFTNGTSSTTTLLDADVPDDITITNVPNELSFTSTTHDYLTSGTTTITYLDGNPDVSATPTSATQLANKWYVDNYFTLCSTSTNLKLSADTAGSSTASTTYEKVKEIQVNPGGIARISFDMKADGSGYYSEGRIYVSGSAVGTLRETNSALYQTYTEDIYIPTQAVVQLYVMRKTADSPYVMYRNFRIYFDTYSTSSIGVVIND